MRITIFVDFLLFVFFESTESQNQFCTIFKKISWGTRIKETYLQFENLSLMQCAGECFRRKRCKSLNYSKQLTFCELNYIENGTHHTREERNVFIHSDISGWDKDLIGVCKNSICTDNEKCNERGCCEISDCGPAPDPPDNAVVLQTGHHEVGNGFYFSCNEGYLIMSINNTNVRRNTTIPVNCLQNGKWEQHSFKCEEKQMFNEQRYFFSDEHMNWKNAQNFCRTMDSHLVKLDSQAKFNWILSIITQKNMEAWTGGNDIAQKGTWVWDVDNTEIKWQNWYPGEPNNFIEDCILLLPRMTGWFDYICEGTRKFICEQ